MSQTLPKINSIKTVNFNWINIIEPGNEEINYLKNNYKFHPLDLRDAHITKKAQRPQLSQRSDYTFLIFYYISILV